MKLDQILGYYVTPVRQFDANLSAEDILKTYRDSARYTDIDVFISKRLQSKFSQIIQTQEQQDYLQLKAKKIAQLAQNLFDKKNPTADSE